MKYHNRNHPPHLATGMDQTVLSRLAALKGMSVKELKAEWQALFGDRPEQQPRLP